MLVVFIPIILIGCMQNFKMSPKEVELYYLVHPPKPLFQYFTNQHKTIHYACSANNSHRILLLIHGAPGAWFGYKEYISDPVLLKYFKIIVPDRLGYHKSDPQTSSIDQQAKALKSLLAQFPTAEITVLGRSYGAPIAARLAMNYPNLIKHLILVAPACAPALEKFWWFSKPVNTGLVRFFLPRFINTASDEKFRHQQELKEIEPDWGKITCPVTILQGGKDWIIDTKNGKYVDSALTNAPKKFIYLPENSHLLTYERKELMEELILETLQR